MQYVIGVGEERKEGLVRQVVRINGRFAGCFNTDFLANAFKRRVIDRFNALSDPSDRDAYIERIIKENSIYE